MNPLVTGGLVLALMVFMLIRQVELRARVIQLVGGSRLPVATKAIDEAAARISHYLLCQTVINGTFGCAVALGLFLIGVPYAVLWGFLAAVLRFIPDAGRGWRRSCRSPWPWPSSRAGSSPSWCSACSSCWSR